MINKPKAWESVNVYSDKPRLPVGGYVAKIKQANIVTQSNGSQQLCLLFDIVEGEYSGFYNREYATNQMENKKWKGVLRQWLPKDDGSEQDERTIRFFKGLITAVEESNTGWYWGWNEKNFRDCLIGVVMRNEEWEFNGKHGWAVRPFRAASVDAIRTGNFTIPEDKPLRSDSNYDASAYDAPVPTAWEEQEDDGELPF